jgi:hypothetical protein
MKRSKIGALLSLIAACGCGSAPREAADGDVGGGTLKEPPSTVADYEISIGGQAFELLPGFANFEDAIRPIEDVDVCLSGPNARCVATSTQGSYAFQDFAPGTRAEITFEKSGYLPTVTRFDLPSYSILGDAIMLSEYTAQGLTRAAQLDGFARSGVIIFTVRSVGYGELAPLADVSIRPDAPAARAVYADTNGAPNATLDATSNAGWGAILALEAGQVRLSITPSAEIAELVACGVWDGSELEPLTESVVLDGHATFISVMCLPKG